jgi:hypothetical protein
MSFDWTHLSDDPNDHRARSKMRSLLPTRRRGVSPIEYSFPDYLFEFFPREE